MDQSEEKNEELKLTKEQAARLMAVQAYYQNTQNHKPIREVIEQYVKNPQLLDVDETLIDQKPHGPLFKKIMTSLNARLAEVAELVQAQLPVRENGEKKELEPLLNAILFCGVVELLDHQDIDAPVIIDDYLNVAHGFYDQAQVSMVNAVLDKVGKLVRE